LGKKRKLGLIARGGTDIVTGQTVAAEATSISSSQRLFVGKLPLAMSASKLRSAFERYQCGVESIHWIVDRDSRAFYGSAFCQMTSIEDAKRAQALGLIPLPRTFKKRGMGKGRKKQQRTARVAFAPLRQDEVWPPTPYNECEYPPLGS